MPGLSCEMAVPFMFHFIEFKLQSVGKQKTDLGVVLGLAGLITPAANTGLPDHLF